MKRVLLIDASTSQGQFIADALNRTGYQVLRTIDGPSALQQLNEERPECVIINTELTGAMSAFEVCSELIENSASPAPPVIFLAPSKADIDLVRALALGGLDFLVPPFDELELQFRISNALKYHSLELALAQARSELQRLSHFDSVTGAYNRNHLAEALNQACSVADRYGRPLSILLADIDHLRVTNDRLGFRAGDEILRRLSRIITDASRTADTSGRFGGGEFLVICPETNLGGATVLANRIRLNAQTALDLRLSRTPVTVSLGCAEKIPGESVDRLLARCETALEAAKLGGRNRVCVSSNLEGSTSPSTTSAEN